MLNIFMILSFSKTSYTNLCLTMILLEYAPLKSPSSFSYGGGVWNGSFLTSSISDLAFSSNFADFNFAMSFNAFFV